MGGWLETFVGTVAAALVGTIAGALVGAIAGALVGAPVGFAGTPVGTTVGVAGAVGPDELPTCPRPPAPDTPVPDTITEIDWATNGEPGTAVAPGVP